MIKIIKRLKNLLFPDVIQVGYWDGNFFIKYSNGRETRYQRVNDNWRKFPGNKSVSKREQNYLNIMEGFCLFGGIDK